MGNIRHTESDEELRERICEAYILHGIKTALHNLGGQNLDALAEAYGLTRGEELDVEVLPTSVPTNLSIWSWRKP